MIRLTVLGCGSSGGVPLATGNWGSCDPTNPKDHRTRASVVLHLPQGNLLIDAGPDFRHQVLSQKISRIDAVLFTHEHADHIHGMDDLRFVSYAQKGPIPCFARPKVLKILQEKFSYILQQQSPEYPAILDGQEIWGDEIEILGAKLQVFDMPHGRTTTLGLRWGDLAYCTDCGDLPAEILNKLQGLDTWIVDCVREKPHPSHAHFALVESWVHLLRPRITYLTHMAHEFSFARAEALGAAYNIHPLWDGMLL